MAHDVFISHARKDKVIADAICEKLESAQIQCWIAERDISAGEDWTEATRNAIGFSRLIVLVLSENANAAPHIEREIANAFYTGRMIVPFRSAKSLPRREFLFYLSDARWIDAVSQSADDDVKTLATRIKGLLADAPFPHDFSSQSLMKSRVTLNAMGDGWGGGPRRLPFGIPRILKRIGIPAAVIVAVGLAWWLAARQTDGDGVSNGDDSVSIHRNRGGNAPAPANPAASEQGPHYTFSRFGLWVPANANPAPRVEVTPPNISSSSPEGQTVNATPPQSSNIDQNGGVEEEKLSAQHGADARFLSGKAQGSTNNRIRHRGSSRTKVSHSKALPSEGSRLASVKGWVKALFHQGVERIKETLR